MPWPVGQKPPVYNFPIPVFNVVLRAATKGQFCPAGTRELLERDGGRKEGRSKRSSPGGISIHSCSPRDRSFMLFIISLSFTFFNISFPPFCAPSPPSFRTICPFYCSFVFQHTRCLVLPGSEDQPRCRHQLQLIAHPEPRLPVVHLTATSVLAAPTSLPCGSGAAGRAVAVLVISEQPRLRALSLNAHCSRSFQHQRGE